MTARTPYSTVSEISEIQASVVLTPGESPFAVVISPKTTHGWRPISVKIQPAELPASISRGVAIAIRPNHFDVGALPRRVRNRISAAKSAASMPRPIM